MRIENIFKTVCQAFIIMNWHSLQKIIGLNPSTPVWLSGCAARAMHSMADKAIGAQYAGAQHAHFAVGHVGVR